MTFTRDPRKTALLPFTQAALLPFTLPMLLAFAACSTTRSGSAGGDAAFPARIIDAHIHTRFTGGTERTTGIALTKEQLLREMRENGVVGAVAHAGANEENYVEGMREHGVIHCIGAGYSPDPVRVEKLLRSGRYSCVKVYLGYVSRYANDPVYTPIYRLAEKYDVPVVFHTGDTYDSNGKVKYADPLFIDEVAVDHRKVRFVIAHLGNPWIQSAAEVAYKNPNVWVEASALLIGNMDRLPPAQVEEFLVKPLRWAFGYVENPKKFLFGTDWPINDIGAYLRAYRRAIPREHWQAVFHDNARAVFRFPEAASVAAARP